MGARRQALLFALLGGLALLLALVPATRPLVGAADTRTEQVALASTGVYVSLRTINAAISLIRETEIGGSAVVVGTVRPLGWLDPIDDTVERMAGLVFWVALAAGVISLALDPLAVVGWAVLALAAGLRCAACLGWHSAAPPALLRASERGLVILGAALAILLPLVLWGGLALGERLTEERWRTAWNELSVVEDAADSVVEPYGGPTDAEDPAGWWARLRGGVGETTEAITAYAQVAGVLWDKADTLFSASLTLAGIFLLRLVVLPAVLMLVALAFLRRVALG